MSGDFKENQETIVKLSVQAEEFKKHPYYSRLANEMAKEIAKLRRELRKVGRQVNFEKYGRRQLIINTQLNAYEHWHSIIDSDIKKGSTARGKLREME